MGSFDSPPPQVLLEASKGVAASYKKKFTFHFHGTFPFDIKNIELEGNENSTVYRRQRY